MRTARTAKTKSPPSHRSLAEYILHQSGRPTWQVRPNDPDIYVSFSLTQLRGAYDSLALREILNYNAADWAMPLTSQEINPERITTFKNLIRKEWIERGNMSYLKFLPPDANAEDIRNKNVIFILEKEYIPSLPQHANSMAFTYPLSTDMTIPAHYKLIHLSEPESSLTNMHQYDFLHELFHAVVGGKHFTFQHQGDKPPFNSDMTCEDSVMAYQDECPPWLKRWEHISKCSYPLSKQYIAEELASAWPPHLGPADIAAIQVFKEQWEIQNKENVCRINVKATSTTDIEYNIRTRFFGENLTVSTESKAPINTTQALLSVTLAGLALAGAAATTKKLLNTFSLWSKPTLSKTEQMELEKLTWQVQTLEKPLLHAYHTRAYHLGLTRDKLSDVKARINEIKELIQEAIVKKSFRNKSIIINYIAECQTKLTFCTDSKKEKQLKKFIRKEEIQQARLARRKGMTGF